MDSKSQGIETFFRRCGGVFMMLTLACLGCTRLDSKSKADYTTIAADSADTARARELNAKGAAALRNDQCEKAERLFRDALLADVNFGPAHNNLGNIYYRQRKLYMAAWEYELASNTMPERIEPLLNLGAVYELAQRWERAEEFYRDALARSPESADAIGPLARLLVKRNGDQREVNYLLHEILLHDSRPSWIQWAGELLNTRYRDEICLDSTQSFSEAGSVPAAPGPETLESSPLPSPRESERESGPAERSRLPPPAPEVSGPTLRPAPPVMLGPQPLSSLPRALDITQRPPQLQPITTPAPSSMPPSLPPQTPANSPPSSVVPATYAQPNIAPDTARVPWDTLFEQGSDP